MAQVLTDDQTWRTATLREDVVVPCKRWLAEILKARRPDPEPPYFPRA